MSHEAADPPPADERGNTSPDAPDVLGAEAPGTVLGQYRIDEAIGEGGFGTVYRAVQTHPVQRSVALKILKLGMDTRQVVARFEAERQALALMDHPAIAKVYDAGATETGRPYFVMELVDGEPLTDYCDRKELATDERLRLFVDVCLAVQHAHQKGVLHRDLKPSNVLVTEVDGVGGAPLPKVIDFGIAKAIERPLTDSSLATEAFQIMGTPEYMPPEQASGNDVDTRADVYALGVMLYELLTGSQPFTRATGGLDDLGALLRQIHDVTPPKPSTRASELAGRSGESPSAAMAMRARTLRGDLDWIVMKAIEKDRERRYDSATALADDIGRHLADEPVLASPPSTTYRLRKFVRRNRLLVAATGVVATTVLVAGVLLVWGFFEVRGERDAARVAREHEEIARQAAEEALADTERARQEEARAREAESAARATAETALEQTELARQAETAARTAAEESLEEANEVTDFLTDMLASVDPEEDGLEVTVRQVLDRSARNLATRFAMRPRVHGRLALTVGSTYRQLGAPQVAEPYLQEALSIVRDTHGPSSPTYATAVRNMGALRLDQERFAEAEALIREWNDLVIAGGRPLQVAQAQGALGYLHRLTGEYEQAEREFLEAIERIEAVDPGSTALAVHLQNLGSLYSNIGREAEAHELAERVYGIYMDAYGPEHPDTLRARRNRLNGLRARGDVEEATREALAILETARRVTGRVHPDTLESLEWVALDMRENGRFEESIRMSREVVAGRKEILGERHPEVGRSLRVLGIALWQAGRVEEAVPALDESVELLSAELGPGHPETLNARNVRTILDYERGRYEESLASWTEILRLQEQVGDPEGVLNTKINIAMVQGDLGLYAEAEAGHLEGIELATELSGPESTVVQNLMNNLAVLYERLGRYDAAEALNVELIEMRERLLGPDSPLTVGTWSNLAAVYSRQGRYEEALDIYTGQLDQQLEILGPDHPMIGKVQIALGRVHALLGDTEVAERCFREALAIFPRSMDPDAALLSIAHLELGVLLRDTGRPEEAEEHLSLAFENNARVLGEEHEDTLQAAAALAVLYGRTERPEEERALWKRVLDQRERSAQAPGARTAELWVYADALLDAPQGLADPERALDFALRARESVNAPHPELLATVARAYGASGDADSSARVAREALDRLPEVSPLRAELERLLREEAAR